VLETNNYFVPLGNDVLNGMAGIRETSIPFGATLLVGIKAAGIARGNNIVGNDLVKNIRAGPSLFDESTRNGLVLFYGHRTYSFPVW
jgi:hypothetical protein